MIEARPSEDAHGERGLAVVVGAAGGIGRALAEGLLARGFAPVVAMSRHGLDGWPEDSIRRWLYGDVIEEASIVEAADAVRTIGEPTCIVVASGLLHGPGVRPERTMRDLDPEAFLKLQAVNALGPALVAKHFLPLTPRDRPSLFAALSARVGSLGDNRLGGWYSYRASKAALNMLMLTLSIEHRRTRPLGICATLHPGTVATALSAPFVRGRTLEQRFEPEQAAGQLLAVMDQLTPDDSGGFFAWDGASIPW